MNLRDELISAGINPEILDEIVDKSMILVRDEALPAEVADIMGFDNYYFYEGEKMIEDYPFDLVGVSIL